MNAAAEATAAEATAARDKRLRWEIIVILGESIWVTLLLFQAQKIVRLIWSTLSWVDLEVVSLLCKYEARKRQR